MNFCTKCESYYQQPGTCNCYANVVTTFFGGVPLFPYGQDETAAPWCPFCQSFHAMPCQRRATCEDWSISFTGNP